MTKEQLYQRIVAILQDTFDIEPHASSLDARLGDDLDIDSIDAVDLIVQLKPLIGSAPASPRPSSPCARCRTWWMRCTA